METENQIPKANLIFTNFQKSLVKPNLIINNDESIGMLFLKTLTKVSKEDAKKYVSKEFIDIIDLDEIRYYLLENKNYTLSDRIHFKPKSKDLKINSIFVKDIRNDNNSIINLYLVFEPDYYSNWKVCGIDKETGKSGSIIKACFTNKNLSKINF